MNIFNNNFLLKVLHQQADIQDEISGLEEEFDEEIFEDDLDEELCVTSPQGLRERLFDKPYNLQGGEGLSDSYLHRDLQKANQAFLNCELY